MLCEDSHRLYNNNDNKYLLHNIIIYMTLLQLKVEWHTIQFKV